MTQPAERTFPPPQPVERHTRIPHRNRIELAVALGAGLLALIAMAVFG